MIFFFMSSWSWNNSSAIVKVYLNERTACVVYLSCCECEWHWKEARKSVSSRSLTVKKKQRINQFSVFLVFFLNPVENTLWMPCFEKCIKPPKRKVGVASYPHLCLIKACACPASVGDHEKPSFARFPSWTLGVVFSVRVFFFFFLSNLVYVSSLEWMD